MMISANKNRGFTLIEIVMVLITVSLVAVPIVGMFGNIGKGLILNSQLSEADGYVQACAEHIIVNKKLSGIASIDSTTCSGITTSAAFTLNVVTTTDVSAHASCPTAIGTPTCKIAEITAISGGNVHSSSAIFLVE